MLSILISIVLLGCVKEETPVVEEEVKVEDSREPLTLVEGEVVTKSYVDSLTGKTIYVDYSYAMRSAKELKEIAQKNRVFDEYYVVTAFTTWKNIEKFKVEMEKWQKREPDTYMEVYGKGASLKYMVTLAKCETQDEAIKLLKEYKLKYPDERLNFHYISK